MPQKNNLSLQKQLTELDELLMWFEQDDFDLEEALGKYEHGMALVEQIKKRLVDVENKVTVLQRKFDQAD